MTEIYTIFNKPQKKPSPAGNHIQIEHRLHVDKDGKTKLIWDKKVNIYDKIQEGREQTEIDFIMRKATEGDTTILNMVKGQYMDVTDMPSTLAQAQQIHINLKNQFFELPWDIRKEYNDDADQYIADIGTKHWCDITGITADQEHQAAIAKAEAEQKAMMDQAIKNLAEGNMIKASTEGGNQ